DDWRRSEDRPRCDRALSGTEKGIRRPQNPRRRRGPLITCPANRGEDGPLVRQGGAALNKSRLCVASLCALALLVVNSASSFAQARASISGTVKDPAGGLIPGATVVVKNETTGNSQETVTDKDGAYQISALGAGSYTVTASLAGFKTAIAKDVRVA